MANSFDQLGCRLLLWPPCIISNRIKEIIMWESFANVFGGCFGLVCGFLALLVGCAVVTRIFKL